VIDEEQAKGEAELANNTRIAGMVLKEALYLEFEHLVLVWDDGDCVGFELHDDILVLIKSDGETAKTIVIADQAFGELKKAFAAMLREEKQAGG
jgi:hypothetical protein